MGWCAVTSGELIPVQVDGVEIAVEAVGPTGTEDTWGGRVSKAADGVVDAFGRAEEAILAVARSTAAMIDRTGAAARPDRVEVEFGLKFSASGGVIMAGVAGEASLKVTLSYDVAARPPSALPDAAVPDGEAQPTEIPAVAETASVAAGSA